MPCEACLKKTKAWRTSARIAGEIAASQRSWWCTFTLADLPDASEGEVYASVQLMVKRLRKKHSLRYAFVPEYGEQRGRLHYHAIVHCDDTLTKRLLCEHWPGGFSRVRLLKGWKTRGTGSVSVRAVGRIARYIAKYVTKGQGRFRFSQGYGSRPWVPVSEIEQAILDTFPGSTRGKCRAFGISMPYKLCRGKPLPSVEPPLHPDVQADIDDWRHNRGEFAPGAVHAPAKQVRAGVWVAPKVGKLSPADRRRAYLTAIPVGP